MGFIAKVSLALISLCLPLSTLSRFTDSNSGGTVPQNLTIIPHGRIVERVRDPTIDMVGLLRMRRSGRDGDYPASLIETWRSEFVIGRVLTDRDRLSGVRYLRQELGPASRLVDPVIDQARPR